VMPWFLIFSIPIAVVYVIIQQYYRTGCRELGRLNSMSSSPIFAQYTETIEGLDSIRAYELEARLIEENRNLLNKNCRTVFTLFSAQRWLAVRVELVGSCVLTSVSFLILWFHGSISDGYAGLLLTLAASITGDLSWYVRQATQLESQMNTVERILHYTATPSEAPLIIEDHRPPPEWPNHGKIEFKNVSMRYRKDLDLVLKEVSFTILPREKIGVVGRTGAGKSSLTDILFRLVEPESSGSISIDEIDIGQLGLRDLRSRLAIIPQDPFLFSGTIRSNLDPFTLYTDTAVWVALERVHMADFVRSLALGLSYEINEKGSNLSVGQRQLLCMGRALLRETTILVVDEATASVDNETDALIQQTIRSEFKNRTVLTVAHRLNTIMDSDRILVLDKGRIAEFDTPAKLLEKERGVFRNLVNKADKRLGDLVSERQREASG